MIRRPPRSTQSRSSAASDVYKRQGDGVGSGSGEVAHLLGTGSGFAPRPRTAGLAIGGIVGSPVQSGVLAAFDLAGIIKIHRGRIVAAVLRAGRFGLAAFTTAVAAGIAP